MNEWFASAPKNLPTPYPERSNKKLAQAGNMEIHRYEFEYNHLIKIP
jgi:hypothetical protein